MRVTTRFAAIALWVILLTALPSRAGDNPAVYIVGYQCEVVKDSNTPAGMSGLTLMACQIGDDAEPFSTVRPPLSESTPTPPTPDSLLNLLTILDDARHEASLQRHDAVVPTPAP